MRKLFLAAASAAILASVGAAYALEDNQAQLNISADVREGCTLKFQAANIALGLINKSNPQPTIQQSSFNVICDGQPARVDLDMGKNSDGTNRYMSLTDADKNVHKLHYEVYQGGNQAQVWGTDKNTYNIPAGNTVSPGMANNFNVTVTPADVRDANVVSGHYEDILVATVYYGNSAAQ